MLLYLDIAPQNCDDIVVFKLLICAFNAFALPLTMVWQVLTAWAIDVVVGDLLYAVKSLFASPLKFSRSAFIKLVVPATLLVASETAAFAPQVAKLPRPSLLPKALLAADPPLAAVPCSADAPETHDPGTLQLLITFAHPFWPLNKIRLMVSGASASGARNVRN